VVPYGFLSSGLRAALLTSSVRPPTGTAPADAPTWTSCLRGPATVTLPPACDPQAQPELGRSVFRAAECALSRSLVPITELWRFGASLGPLRPSLDKRLSRP
jgi:hypothetical protein